MLQKPYLVHTRSHVRVMMSTVTRQPVSLAPAQAPVTWLCQKPAGLQPAHTWVLCSRGSGWTQAYHLVMTMLITSVEGVRVPEGR